jgi:molybdopterin molybdotransferase
VAVSIEEARAAVLEHAHTLAAETVPLERALGRTLAVDAIAPAHIPPVATSAMDGYAIVAADTVGGSARLHLIGEATAGTSAGVTVSPGAAVRISTGAPMPQGADAVVPQELAHRQDSTIAVSHETLVGRHVRPAGEDIRACELLMPAGALLGPAELGVLALLDILQPTVVRQPRVAIVGTGDEVTGSGNDLGPYRIRDSNGPALGGAVERAGGELVARMHAHDDLAATIAVLDSASQDVDLLISTGGVSVGPHDHVRPALERLGFREVFAGIRLKPARPTTFAIDDDGMLVFALPGNPASALIAFALLVVPALDVMLGHRGVMHPLTAVAGADLAGALGRTAVVRCRTELHQDGWHVFPMASQASHVAASMLGVDALALVPAGHKRIEAGECVEIEFVAPELDRWVYRQQVRAAATRGATARYQQAERLRG